MLRSLPIATMGPWLFLKPFLKSVSGKHHVPLHGAFLMAANHTSLLDGPILTAWMNRYRYSPTHTISHHEPFEHWFFRWLLRGGRCLCLRRGDPEDGIAVLELSLAYLARGEAVGIFPEGRINMADRLRRLRPGLAILALESGAPILPVGIRGATRVLPPNGGAFRFRRTVELHIGSPIPMVDRAHQYRTSDAPARQKLIEEVLAETGELIASLAGTHPPKPLRIRTPRNTNPDA